MTMVLVLIKITSSFPVNVVQAIVLVISLDKSQGGELKD